MKAIAKIIMIGTTVLLAAGAFADGGLELSGRWRLNKELSDDPREVIAAQMKETGGWRVGGPGMHGGGRQGGPYRDRDEADIGSTNEERHGQQNQAGQRLRKACNKREKGCQGRTYTGVPTVTIANSSFMSKL
ncbi:MAG: hypothetical protein ACWGSD_12450 [Thermodesulfobacteriota bacterium]